MDEQTQASVVEAVLSGGEVIQCPFCGACVMCDEPVDHELTRTAAYYFKDVHSKPYVSRCAIKGVSKRHA